MEKKIVLQENLQSKLSIKPSSFYKKISLPPISGATVVIGAAPSQSTFYITAANINYSKMELTMGVQIPLLAAASVLLRCGYFPFLTRLELFSQSSNTYLCDVLNLDKLSKMTSLIYNDYKKRSVQNGFCFKSCRSASNFANLGDLANNLVDPTQGVIANSAINHPPNAIDNNDSSAPNNALLENNLPAFLIGGATNVAFNAANTSFFMTIRLGDLIHDSIFSINKDIMSENLILRLTWNTQDKIYFTAVTATDVSAVGVNNVTINGLQINVYSQANPDINKTIVERSKNSEEIIIPYLNLYTQSFTGGLQNHNAAIRPICGYANAHLYKTYSSIFLGDYLPAINANGVPNVQYWSSPMVNLNQNHQSGIWNNITYYLNSELIKRVDSLINEDFDDMVKCFHKDGTSLYDRSAVRETGTVIQVFDSDKINVETEYDKNELKGLSYLYLGNQINIINNWAIAPQTTAAPFITSATHYYYCVNLCSIYVKDGRFNMLP